MTVIKREEVGAIAKTLHECNHLLTRQNLYSSIVKFREALDMMMQTPMLHTDERELKDMVNAFQNRLASSRVFYECYGPVSFRDDKIETTAEFMKQLIEVKEEEIREEMERLHREEEASNTGKETYPQAEAVRILIERGDYELARNLIGDDEDFLAYMVNYYNERGIAARREGRCDHAVSEFRKIVSLCPDDEGLYYNLARAYLEKKEYASAHDTIMEALRLNPDFPEGEKLLAFIERQMEQKGLREG